MSIGIINDIGSNPYTSKSNTAKTTKTDGTFMKCVSAGGQKVSLCSDALMSYASPQTGESINIYKAEDYSEENPRYLIRGLDANGNEFEQEVDAGKINPNQCSYNELMVLNLETGHTSPSDYLHAVAVRDKAGTDSYFKKADYMAYARAVMGDQKTMGNWASYLAYDKWIQSLMDYADRANKTDFDEKAFEEIAPNAPKEVKNAWMEAAKETGVNGMGMGKDGKLSHISQLMVQRLTNIYNGKLNPNDILGSTVQSALYAVKKALYDLEHPLEPVSHQSMEVQQQKMKEKEFYQAFIEKLEQL